MIERGHDGDGKGPFVKAVQSGGELVGTGVTLAVVARGGKGMGNVIIFVEGQAHIRIRECGVLKRERSRSPKKEDRLQIRCQLGMGNG